MCVLFFMIRILLNGILRFFVNFFILMQFALTGVKTKSKLLKDDLER
jgi:hypothetical protein